jgi:hypothetical protein
MLLASQALGAEVDPLTAATRRLTIAATYEPDPVRHDRYRRLAPLYDALAASIKPI